MPRVPRKVRPPSPRLGFETGPQISSADEPADIPANVDDDFQAPTFGLLIARPQIARDSKTCCEFFFEGYDRGGYMPHTMLLLRHFRSTLNLGVVVRTPDGDVARFDGGAPHPVPNRVVEAKTGRQWAFFLQPFRWSFVQNNIFNRDTEQFATQQRVAAKCKLSYSILFDNENGLRGYQQHLPQYAPLMH